MLSSIRVGFSRLNLVVPELLRNDLNSVELDEIESTTIQPDSDVTFTNITKAPIDESSPLDDFPEDFFTGLFPRRIYLFLHYFDHISTRTHTVHSQNIKLYAISDYQRNNGAIIVHLLAALYFFVLLAIVCDDYFLPSVECVCEDLNISKVIQSL